MADPAVEALLLDAERKDELQEWLNMNCASKLDQLVGYLKAGNHNALKIATCEALITAFTHGFGLSPHAEEELFKVFTEEEDRIVRRNITEAVVSCCFFRLQRQLPSTLDVVLPDLYSTMMDILTGDNIVRISSVLKAITLLSGNRVAIDFCPALKLTARDVAIKSIEHDDVELSLDACLFILRSCTQSVPELLPRILATLEKVAVDASQLEVYVHVVGALSDVAVTDDFFRFSPLIIESCQKIATNSEMCPKIREAVLETICVVMEAFAPRLRKNAVLIKTIISTCLAVRADLPEDPELARIKAERIDEHDPELVHTEAAGMCMDRISILVPGKIVVKLVFELLPPMLKRPEWQNRYAAFLSLADMVEGMRQSLKSSLKLLVDPLIGGMQDSDPRVRWASAHAIGQMSTDLSPEHLGEKSLQHQAFDEVMTALMKALKDPYHNVRAHAACAMVNFCEEIEEEGLFKQSYCDPLVTTLFQLIADSSHIVVQESAMAAVSGFATVLKKSFIRYYGTIMPVLITVVQQAKGERFAKLRSRALESASIIGRFIGKEGFLEHGKQLMVLTLGGEDIASLAQEKPAESDSYLIQAWSRIYMVLKSDFKPFIPKIAELLAQTLSYDPPTEIRLLELVAGGEDVDSDYLELGERHEYALDLIGRLGMEDNFPVENMLPLLLGLEMRDELCQAITTSFWGYLRVHQNDGGAFAEGMYERVCDKMVTFAEVNDFNTGNYVPYRTLAHCLRGISKFHPDGGVEIDCTFLLEIVRRELTHFLNGAYDDSEDEDEEDEDDQDDQDDEEELTSLLSSLEYMFESAARFNKGARMDFSCVELFYFLLVGENYDTEQKNLAVNAFCDLIEFGEPDCIEIYAPRFIGAMMIHLQISCSFLRQSIFYSLGQYCAKRLQGYQEIAEGLIPKMKEAMRENHDDDEWTDCKDNIIAAYVQIVATPDCGDDLETAIPLLAQWLPLEADWEEACNVLKFLTHNLSNPIFLRDPVLLASIFAASADMMKLVAKHTSDVQPGNDWAKDTLRDYTVDPDSQLKETSLAFCALFARTPDLFANVKDNLSPHGREITQEMFPDEQW